LAALARGFSDHHFERGEGPGDEVEIEEDKIDVHVVAKVEIDIQR